MSVILKQIEDTTAPLIVCDSCGERIKDHGMAWVMWKQLLKPGETIKPLFLCKENHCNAKPEYFDFASMELGEFLIDLCRNAGMESEEDFREALEFAHLGDQI